MNQWAEGTACEAWKRKRWATSASTESSSSRKPFFSPISFFDEATPEALAPHRHWLEPRALDPATGNLVMPVQSYLVRTRHHTILIDTCVGCRKSSDRVDEWRGLTDES